MKISPQASKGHLLVGGLLVILSLVAFIAMLVFQRSIFAFLIFFFGVWGGVELGRYLEHYLQSSMENQNDNTNSQ